jgi:hypothetical protein
MSDSETYALKLPKEIVYRLFLAGVWFALDELAVLEKSRS